MPGGGSSAGTDFLIRRQLGEMCDHAPLEGGELGTTDPGAWLPPRAAAWNSHLRLPRDRTKTGDLEDAFSPSLPRAPTRLRNGASELAIRVR